MGAEEAEPCPRGELVRVAGERHDCLSSGQGKVGAGGVVPACRQDVHEWREHERIPAKAGDTAGRVADDPADGKAEETDDGQVERGAEHGACDARVTEGDVDVLPGEDRLAHPERDEVAGVASARTTRP